MKCKIIEYWFRCAFCDLWFSPLSIVVSQHSPSVCGFLSPLECHVWAEHSWSILITLAGWRWRKKEIDHKGKGRNKKKSGRELKGEILGQQKWGREFLLSLFFFVPKLLFGTEKQGQHEFWTLVHVGIAIREPCWSTKACKLALLECGYTKLGRENNYPIVTTFIYALWYVSCVLYIKDVHLHK